MKIRLADLRKIIREELALIAEKDDWNDTADTSDLPDPSDDTVDLEKEPWRLIPDLKKKKRDPKKPSTGSRDRYVQSLPPPDPMPGKPDWSMTAAEIRDQFPLTAEPDDYKHSRRLYRQSKAARANVPSLGQALSSPAGLPGEPTNDADYEMPGEPVLRPQASGDEPTNPGSSGRARTHRQADTEPGAKRPRSSKKNLGSVIPQGF